MRPTNEKKQRNLTIYIRNGRSRRAILINSDQSCSLQEISVIIPTRNEGKVIHSCLSSVFYQSVKPLEVIGVDGRSTDDTLEEARQFPVKILSQTGPTSLPSARNLGIQLKKSLRIHVLKRHRLAGFSELQIRLE